MADTPSVREAIGVRFSRGAHGFAESSAWKVIARQRLDADVLIGISIFELPPQLLVIKLLGIANEAV